MRTSAPRIFTGISRDTFERMKSDLRSIGVSVPDGDECVLSHRGVSGSLVYSETSRRVEIRIRKTPLFVSDSVAMAMLDKAMRRYTRHGPDASDDT